MDSDERNTLATTTREDKAYIHMRRGDTGGNNQGSGESPVTQEEGQVTAV